MKFLVLVLSMILTASAFAANPFAGFVGKYMPSSAPQVVMKNMKYCNWQGFRTIKAVEISLKDGVYVADLTSDIGSEMHSFTTFEEYDYANEFGTKNRASILAGRNSADYQVVNSGKNYMQVYHWIISQSNSNFHLRLEYRESIASSEVNSCLYDVDLQKQ